MSQVLVIGSINIDLVVTVPHLPQPGETVLGSRFERHFGGKGANQAVAAARAGARVTMLGAVGRDAHGDESLAALAAEGIDVSRVRRVDEPTGVALITVDPNGENQIAVAPGANRLVAADALELAGPPSGTVLLAGRRHLFRGALRLACPGAADPGGSDGGQRRGRPERHSGWSAGGHAHPDRDRG